MSRLAEDTTEPIELIDATAGVPDAIARAEAELVGPGGFCEIEDADVLGERMPVFKNRARSLRALVAASAAFGDGHYLIFSDGTRRRAITFRAHERLVASTAAVLRDRYGVGPGDRVAILAANCPEWIVTFWATVSLGAVAVGLNGWWTGPEIRFALDDCTPKLLVADRRRLARLDDGATTGVATGVPTVIIEDGFEALWRGVPSAALPDPAIAEDDPAVILYTSGTTGRPKGAVHSHRNVIALTMLNFFNGMRLRAANPVPPDAPPNCQLVTSPLFHVSGLHSAAVACLAGGVTSVWLSGRFDAGVALQLIETERCTGWSYTATVLHRLLHHPDAKTRDLSSIRQIGGGGSPIAPSLQARAKELMPALRPTFGVGYGLTECTALATLNAGDELTAHPTSVGRPMPTVAVAVRGPDGRDLPDGEDGEIHIRGPLVMLGYWNNLRATAEAIGAGRWLRTGDIGQFRDGRLYLATRKRDLIVRGGENVYPAEIEQRLEEHPSVAEAAVVGVDHDELGQEVKAVVVPASGATVDPGELARWVAAALAYFKVPAHWELRHEPLPRNATGKVLKHALAADAVASQFVEE